MLRQDMGDVRTRYLGMCWELSVPNLSDMSVYLTTCHNLKWRYLRFVNVGNVICLRTQKVNSGFKSKPSEEASYRQSMDDRPSKCFTACKTGNTRLRSPRERKRESNCTLDTFDLQSVDIGIESVHSPGRSAVSCQQDRRHSPSPRFYSTRRHNSQALLKLAAKRGKRPFTSCGQRQQHSHQEQRGRGNSGRTRRGYFHAPSEISRRNREVVLIYAGGGGQGESKMIISPRDHPETTWSSEVNTPYATHRNIAPLS